MLLHRLFQGSTWIGQVGDQASLTAMRDAQSDPGTMNGGCKQDQFLSGFATPDVSEISSRLVKAQVAPDLPSSTWTKAAKRVTAASVDWRKEGHSFRRVTFTDYFESLSGHDQYAESHMIDLYAIG